MKWRNLVTIIWVLPKITNKSYKLIITPVNKLMGKLLFKGVFKIGDMCYVSVFPEHHCSYVNRIRYLKSDSLLPEIFFYLLQ